MALAFVRGLIRLGERMKVAVLIDGGHLRALARRFGKTYDPNLVETIAHSCVDSDEELLRIHYYDCAPYVGTLRAPVSGKELQFSGSDTWLRDLAQRNLFAIRTGILKFRGFKPKKIPVSGRQLTDDDFRPDFEQKGVDMRIGLDMANFANQRTADRLILITGDTDCVPAMKYARIAGLQVALVRFPNHPVSPELLWHTDISRHVEWP